MLPTDPWPQTVALARRLAERGYTSLWTYDHLSRRRYRERPWVAAIPWLTGLAGEVTQFFLLDLLLPPDHVAHPSGVLFIADSKLNKSLRFW